MTKYFGRISPLYRIFCFVFLLSIVPAYSWAAEDVPRRVYKSNISFENKPYMDLITTENFTEADKKRAFEKMKFLWPEGKYEFLITSPKETFRCFGEIVYAEEKTTANCDDERATIWYISQGGMNTFENIMLDSVEKNVTLKINGPNGLFFEQKITFEPAIMMDESIIDHLYKKVDVVWQERPAE